MADKLSIEELTVFCKKKGFVFQAGEIYGGLSGFFDFGPLGVELKNNIKREFIKNFIHKREDLFLQDGSVITNPNVWKASGHIDNFADLILTTKESKTKLRADHFIEDQLKIPADGMSAKDINELIKLPGIGRKTANVFLTEIGKVHAIAVDTHVYRISKKLGWAKGNTPDKVERELYDLFPKRYWNSINPTLVRFGKGYGTSRKKEDEILEKIRSLSH